MKKILNKKYFVPIVGIVIIAIIAIFQIVKIGDNAKKDIIVKTQTFQGLTFSDTKLKYENGTTYFTVKVKNDTKNDITKEYVDLALYDDSSTQIITLPIYIGGTIKPNETKDVQVSVATEIAKDKVKEFKYEEHKD